ncbi:uncharacterized protein [Littorina saxatilis]|uniref:uncharacterized protein n=1 Tax=Littorina saxatilis TaxID=31220 RepID=UPI0038B56044
MKMITHFPKAGQMKSTKKTRKRSVSGHQKKLQCSVSSSQQQTTGQISSSGVTECAWRCSATVSSLLRDNAAIVVTLLVSLVTLVIRVYYVTLDTSWWILHPDEIYQSLEVAHSEVYGYGFRTFEFLAPAKGDNLSLYQQRELQLGMYALRSPLYPRFYVIVSWLTGMLGCRAAPYLVWRIAHVVVSSLLPLAAHVFASSLFRSRDVGVVAAMLVGSSVHLNILGTHTLVHSFLAPGIFLSLAGIMSLFLVKPDSITVEESHTNRTVLKAVKKEDKSPECVVHEQSADENVAVYAENTKKVSSFENSSKSSQSRHTLLRNTELSSCSRNLKNETAAMHQGSIAVQSKPVFKSSVLYTVCKLFDKVCCIVSRHSAAPPSALFYSPMVDENANKTSPDKLCMPLKSFSKPEDDEKFCKNDLKEQRTSNGFEKEHDKNFTDFKDKTVHPCSFTKRVTLCTCSFWLVLSCYVRPDSVLLVSALLIPYCFPHTLSKILRHENVFQHVLLSLLGAVAGLAVGIMDDFHFYGAGVISPLNWLRFNGMSNATSQLFGAQSLDFYLHEILFRNEGMVLLAAVNFVGFGITAVCALKEENAEEFRFSSIQKAKLFASFVGLMAVYSLQLHKELRFVHHVIVLYLVLSAANTLSVAKTICATFPKIPSRFSTLLIAVLFASSQWNSFPSVRDGSLSTWVYEGKTENYDVTKCLNFIASRDDVSGVFFDKNVHLIGGYTLLRQNVPILTLTNSGYHEYGLTARTRLKRKLWSDNSGRISVITSSKVSNFFLPQNTRYLLSHLIKHKEFNYLVLSADTDFLDAGFKTIFQTVSTKVVKRAGTRQEEKRLNDVIPVLHLKPEADVLMKEAPQLYAFGLNELAAARYEEAMKKK